MTIIHAISTLEMGIGVGEEDLVILAHTYGANVTKEGSRLSRTSFRFWIGILPPEYTFGDGPKGLVSYDLDTGSRTIVRLIRGA